MYIHIHVFKLCINHPMIFARVPAESRTHQDDLVDIKSNKSVRPRPATATSIPGMLWTPQ